MAKPTKIEIKEEQRIQEANRVLSIASRKMEAGELLDQPSLRLESAQMHQQAIELSVKAMMIVVAGHFYTTHDFPPSTVEETLRARQDKWPDGSHVGIFLERCFAIADRWSSKHPLLTYGYVYGSSGELLITPDEAAQVKNDAQQCLLLARLVVEEYEELRSK